MEDSVKDFEKRKTLSVQVPRCRGTCPAWQGTSPPGGDPPRWRGITRFSV